MSARDRSIREHNENEFRRLSLDAERQQQQQLRFPFHHQPDELLRYVNVNTFILHEKLSSSVALIVFFSRY
jgi:hypothetical protein